jgi:hypothetical protein
MRCHPILDLGLASQIEFGSPRITEQVTRFAPETVHDSGTDHSVLTGDPDNFIGQIEEHRRISLPRFHLAFSADRAAGTTVCSRETSLLVPSRFVLEFGVTRSPHCQSRRSSGEVNWVTDGCFGERPPTVNLSDADLTGSEQRPKQHRGCLS